MALVAYGSSGESDVSDNEESQETTPSPSLVPSSATENAKTGHSDHPIVNGVLDSTEQVNGNKDPVDLIEDDEYDTFLSNRNHANIDIGSGPLNLPAPKASSGTSEISKSASFGLVSENKRQQELSGPALDDDAITLPASEEKKEPKGLDSMVYDDELEEEVKPKTYGAELPKPTAKKSKQPVRITIPSLPDVDSDDEDEPKRKRAKATQVKSGLFSLLPAPKNLSIKEAGRQLVPHTLTRRPPPSKPAAKPAVKKPATVTKPVLAGVPDMDSEDDDEEEEKDESGSCFFSLTSKPTINATPTVAKPPSPTPPPVSAQSSISDSAAEPALRGPWMGPREPSALLSMLPGSSRSTAAVPTAASMSQSQAVAGSSQPHEARPHEALQVGTSMETMDYNEQPYQQYGMEVQDMDSEGMQNYLQDEQFLRIQGKNKRGREEINIIDVNADDQLNPADLIKNLTEETMSSHSRKRKDLPSNQQRRKHQITYLAHQAKEREIELKNQWAQSRQTKRQTQSKYGF